MPNRAAPAGTLVIDKITGTSQNFTYTKLAEIKVPRSTGGSEWHQFHVILQDSYGSVAESAYYRIRNNTKAASASDKDRLAVGIDIQDIVFTPLIPDVIVTKDEADYAPGYPSLQDPVEFLSNDLVSNRWERAPAKYITPKLVWRQEDGAWTETPMTNRLGRTVQGDGTYACVLDMEKDKIYAGPFEYFYRVDFTGYTPTFPAVHYAQIDGINAVVNGRFGWRQYSHLIHTNAWALYTDEAGNTVMWESDKSEWSPVAQAHLFSM